MMKFLILFGMKPGLSKKTFRTHYEVKHAALVGSVSAFSDNMRKYVQNFRMDTACQIRVKSPSLSGCSEIWFDSLEAFFTAYELPDYQILREDEQRFLDFGNIHIGFTEEKVIVPQTNILIPPVKLFRIRNKSASRLPDDFRRFWFEDYAQAMREAITSTSTLAYHQNRSLLGNTNPFPSADMADCIDEFWFSNAEDLCRHIEIEAQVADCLGAAAYLDLARSWDFASTPRVVPGYTLA